MADDTQQILDQVRPADVLPNCLPKVTRKVVWRGPMAWIPLFCANCGADGGLVPEEGSDFAFYLCDPCAEKWAPLAGTMLVPDEVFWQKLNAAQVEKYGRILTPPEQVEALKDGDHLLSKLARDR